MIYIRHDIDNCYQMQAVNRLVIGEHKTEDEMLGRFLIMFIYGLSMSLVSL